MSDVSVDLIVLGLGPAGASAACVAAQAGKSVLAFDRKREAGMPVQCAEFVPSMIGVEVSILAEASIQTITEMLTYVEDECAELTPNFPGKMIDRAAFDAALVDAAIKAGADCRFGVKANEVSSDGVVKLSTGERVRAKTIIGADGVRSSVGAAMGSVNDKIVETRQLTAPLKAAHEATDIYLSSDIPGGYGWLFPKGDVANIGLGVDAAYKDMLKPELEALHARLVDEGRVGEEALCYTGGPIPVGGLIRAHGKLGETLALLAGDAAGLANPVTGAGITSAVISGKLSGEAAVAHLAGDRQAGADYMEELEDLFAPALNRALSHREILLDTYQTNGAMTPAEMKKGWIAYPDYWAA
ncbi:MAG: NAD(P)/FAD-dependent oxidoreductase [Hyphomonadaceae bacterium]